MSAGRPWREMTAAEQLAARARLYRTAIARAAGRGDAAKRQALERQLTGLCGEAERYAVRQAGPEATQ